MDYKTFTASLARQLGKDASETDTLIDMLAKAIKENASALDAVAIPGFGRISPEKKDEYIDIDSQTGKRMLYPPCIRLEFTAGTMLKKRFTHE